MAEFVEVPPERLEPETLDGLLEEFASRDGTDYGFRETALSQRVAQLREQLSGGGARLLFDLESESWDIVDGETARRLLPEVAQ